MKNKELLKLIKKRFTDSELVTRFNLRPLRWYQNQLVLNGNILSIDEALKARYNLTPLILTDFRHSALTEQDNNVQIIGTGGSGKSASGMTLKELDYSFKNRLIDYGEGGNYSIEKFISEIKPNALDFMKALRSPDLLKYDSLMLDEAGQNVREGALSHSLDSYLNDIEQVMRAKWITKFFCSWGTTTNSAQYVLETWDIDRRSHQITLLVFGYPSLAIQGTTVMQVLGHVIIDFPRKELYDAYFKKKITGIDDRLIGQNKLAWEKDKISKELKRNASYQLMNKAQRVNYIERFFPQFLTRSTWVNEIEMMSHIPAPVKIKLLAVVGAGGYDAGNDYLNQILEGDSEVLPSSVIRLEAEYAREKSAKKNKNKKVVCNGQAKAEAEGTVN